MPGQSGYPEPSPTQSPPPSYPSRLRGLQRLPGCVSLWAGRGLLPDAVGPSELQEHQPAPVPLISGVLPKSGLVLSTPKVTPLNSARKAVALHILEVQVVPF